MNQTVTEMKPVGRRVRNIVLAVVLTLAVLIVALNSLVQVPAGHTGVVLQFGAVSSEVLSAGLHGKIPFVTRVVNIDNRVLKAEVDSTSASSDLQNVESTIAVNYRVTPASSAALYRDVGLGFEDVIVKPAIQECVKAVTARFTAEELITQRQTVSEQMRSELQQKIGSYGLNIEIFNIISFEFSEEFNAAIEAKQTAQQNALKAEQDLTRIKVEAQQQIEKAKAEAESYKLKNQEITKETLLMEWINKWDGKLPAVSSDSQMMLDLSELLSAVKDTSSAPSVAAPPPSAPAESEPEE